MRAHDSRLQIFQRAEILDDVAASVIEEQLAVLRTPDRDDPFEVVPVLKQIVDCLCHPAARDDSNLWPWELFLFLLCWHLPDQPSGGRMRGAITPNRLRMPRDLSQ